MITGAAGLYGVHLIEALLPQADVNKIYGLDNFSRPYFGNYPFVDLDATLMRQKLELMRIDFRDLTPQVLDELELDVLVHLAAYVSIPDSMINPDEYLAVNEVGTFKLTQTLLRTKRRPYLIYASSPEVYGTALRIPMDVDHPLYPRSIYAVTKLAAEKHCQVLRYWYAYPVAILRNFNTYGENQSAYGYAAVVANFILWALKGEPLIVHSPGTQTRDFIYVKDAVDVYAKLMGRREKCVGEVLNIGTGKETTILDLAKLIIELTSSSSEIVFEKGRTADVSALCADISRTRQMLDWEPKHSLQEGLMRTIRWYRRFV